MYLCVYVVNLFNVAGLQIASMETQSTSPAFNMPTPASLSRPRATMSLFQTPSSRTATPPADEDGGDGSQSQENLRRSTQDDDR